MRKKNRNSQGVKSENYMEFLGFSPVSDGILEGLANFPRISLGGMKF